MKIVACPGGQALSTVLIGRLESEFNMSSVSCPVKWTWFKNTEQKCEIEESVRGQDVFIVQDCANQDVDFTVSDHVMALFIAIDTVKRAGARRINLVLPTFPYARQHKKAGREGLTAAMISRIIESMGVRNVITLDLHCRELENAFKDVAIENLHASYQMVKQLVQLNDLKNLCVVAPDTGSVERNRFFAQVLGKELYMIYKERDYKKYSVSTCNISDMKLLGDVKGKDCVVFDDMIDTGGTIIKASKLLRDAGARSVYICVSLPFFTGDSLKIFTSEYNKGTFTKVIGTNSVNHPELWKKTWFQTADITKLFSEVVKRVHLDESISEILDSKRIIERFLKDK